MRLAARYLRKYHEPLEAATRVWVLFLLLLTVSAVTMLLFLRSLSRPHVTDTPYNLEAASPAAIQDAIAGGRQATVGLSIEHFLTFDTTGNDFVFEGIVWFDVDAAHVDMARLANFSFDRGEVLSRTALPPEGSRYFYRVRAHLQSALRYEAFPLDDHRLNVVIQNPSMTDHDVAFATRDDALLLAPAAVDQSWHLQRATARAGVASVPLAVGRSSVRTPEAVFTFDFKRVGLRRLFIIFVPLFFVSFLGLSSLTLDPTTDFTSVLSLAVGSLTALLFYELVIDRITPQVEYFTISDRIYTLLLVIGSLTFGLHVVLLHNFENWRQKTALPEVLQFVRSSGAIVRGLAIILSLIVIVVCLVWILP